jgi:selenocysteine lyase/cysteine desulfurase
VTKPPSSDFDVDAIRARFSSLQEGFAFLDAPGGSQVPDEVGDAIARALREASANLGAGYATSARRPGSSAASRTR